MAARTLVEYSSIVCIVKYTPSKYEDPFISGKLPVSKVKGLLSLVLTVQHNTCFASPILW